MDIGIFQPMANSDADPILIAQHAEKLGFESYWAPDHTVVPVDYSIPYPGGTPEEPEPDYLWQMPDPLMLLSSVAAATTKINLGTGVLLVPERNALLTAKQIATLDDMSNGRFLFGVGAGWNPEESKVLGGDFERRWTQVKENIQVMKALWTEHAPEFDGKYNKFPPIRCYPKPKQTPYPPVLLGAINNPKSLKRVAVWGSGWIPVVQSVDEFADGVSQIKRFCDEIGRDSSELDYTVFEIGDQWKSKEHVEKMREAGANRIIFWLSSTDTQSLKNEMEDVLKAVN